MRPVLRLAGSLGIALAAACASAEGRPDPPPESVSAPTLSAGPASRFQPPVAAAGVPGAPLDLGALKLRLRETTAIGVFDKLALRNQLDELLQQLRSHHLGAQKSGVAGLRLAYDSLVIKLLAQVRAGDPPLARSISASQEAIWNILVDPEQFASAS